MRPALKDFIPIRSQDPSFAGWCWFDFFLFFFYAGQGNRYEISADKCEEPRMLLVFRDARAGAVFCILESQHWSLWC